jgi:hypothetical protein
MRKTLLIALVAFASLALPAIGAAGFAGAAREDSLTRIRSKGAPGASG